MKWICENANKGSVLGRCFVLTFMINFGKALTQRRTNPESCNTASDCKIIIFTSTKKKQKSKNLVQTANKNLHYLFNEDIQISKMWFKRKEKIPKPGWHKYLKCLVYEVIKNEKNRKSTCLQGHKKFQKPALQGHKILQISTTCWINKILYYLVFSGLKVSKKPEHSPKHFSKNWV